MTFLCRKQQILLLVADSGTCTFDDVERELALPRSTVNDAVLSLLRDGLVERRKIVRIWHFRPTTLGRGIAKALRAIDALEAAGKQEK